MDKLTIEIILGVIIGFVLVTIFVVIGIADRQHQYNKWLAKRELQKES